MKKTYFAAFLTALLLVLTLATVASADSVELPYTFGFETNPFDNGWTAVDADGDTHNWTWMEDTGSIQSMSWSSGTGSLKPNNWLFSPAFTIPEGGAQIRWDVKTNSPSYPDHYGVFLCTGTNPSDFATNAPVQLYDGTAATAYYVTCSAVIDAQYGGQSCYLAFRHYDSNAMWSFAIDNVQVLPYVARINGQVYLSLADAIGAVQDGETITLLEDNSETVKVCKAVTFTVDPGNYSFNSENITAGSNVLKLDKTTDSGKTTYTVSSDITLPYTFGFETNPFDNGWTAVDADSDGHNWTWMEDTGSIKSESWSDAALNPDNWLFSPAFTIPEGGAQIRWDVKTYNSTYPDHYGVFLCTETNPSSVLDRLYEGRAEQTSYVTCSAVIDAQYGGQSCYLAYRHYNSDDKWSFAIDNVQVLPATAKINEQTYYTLADAVDAVQDGETITLLRDSSVTVKVFKAVTFTVDPGSYSFNSENITAGSNVFKLDKTTQNGKTTYTVSFDITLPYTFNFEDNPFENGWTDFDHDGDGHTWEEGYENYGGSTTDGHNGSHCAVSQSYQNFVGAYNADNWMISPPIPIPEGGVKVSWWAQSRDDSDKDFYAVWVGTELPTWDEGEPNPNNMTRIYPAEGELTKAPKPWAQVKSVLGGEYGGKTVYIAFQHKDYNMYLLEIDDFEVTARNTVAISAAPESFTVGESGKLGYTNLQMEEGLEGLALSDLIITYFRDNGEGADSRWTEIEGVPTEAGHYKVTFVVPENDNYVGRAEVEFDVEEEKKPEEKPKQTNTFRLPTIHILTFHTNGGSKVNGVSRAYGTMLSLDKYIPTRDGYTFGGWYSDPALTRPIEKLQFVGNRSVYAKWIPVESTEETAEN